jgi:hypothetical protein
MPFATICPTLAELAQITGGSQQNPYAVLTLIAAPAILTNASSVLALGTSNRFARAVDRQRQLSKLLDTESSAMGPEELSVRRRQLRITEQRALSLISALTRFYTSLGAFAASALVSLIGAVTMPIGHIWVETVVTALALVAGVIGVGGLVFGCVILIRETRLTVQALREEASLSLHKSEPRGRVKGGAFDEQDPDDDDGSDPDRQREDDALR